MEGDIEQGNWAGFLISLCVCQFWSLFHHILVYPCSGNVNN